MTARASVCFKIYDVCNQKSAISFVDEVLRRLPFQSASDSRRTMARSSVELHWHLEERDIRHVYIRPRTPRLNGKVERSHRVDESKEVFFLFFFFFFFFFLFFFFFFLFSIFTFFLFLFFFFSVFLSFFIFFFIFFLFFFFFFFFLYLDDFFIFFFFFFISFFFFLLFLLIFFFFSTRSLYL